MKSCDLELESKTKKELVEICKLNDIRGCTTKTKTPLINFICRKLEEKDYTIDFEDAIKIYKQRPLRSQVMDAKRRSKTVFIEPNLEWVRNIGRFDVEGIDTPETGQLKKQRSQSITKKINKWHEDSFNLLQKSIGHGIPIKSEDLIDGYINNMAQIMGPDPQWGLNRAWLGDTEWDRRGRRTTTYSADELNRLKNGSIIEIKSGRKRTPDTLYKKINDVWYEVAKKEDWKWKLYGLPSSVPLDTKTQDELALIALNSPDEGTVINVIRKITDPKILEELAITHESFNVSGEAYQQLKRLNPQDPRLTKIRGHYELSTKLRKEREQKQEAARFDFFIANRKGDEQKQLKALDHIYDDKWLRKLLDNPRALHYQPLSDLVKEKIEKKLNI